MCWSLAPFFVVTFGFTLSRCFIELDLCYPIQFLLSTELLFFHHAYPFFYAARSTLYSPTVLFFLHLPIHFIGSPFYVLRGSLLAFPASQYSTIKPRGLPFTSLPPELAALYTVIAVHFQYFVLLLFQASLDYSWQCMTTGTLGLELLVLETHYTSGLKVISATGNQSFTVVIPYFARIFTSAALNRDSSNPRTVAFWEFGVPWACGAHQTTLAGLFGWQTDSVRCIWKTQKNRKEKGMRATWESDTCSTEHIPL